jgi:hypothetical protein
VGRVQPVPVAGLPVLHGLDEHQLIASRRVSEGGPAALGRVGVQAGQGVPPGLAVLGHVGVPPAVRLPRGQPRVDHVQDEDLLVILLAGEQAKQGGGAGGLGGSEEGDRRLRAHPRRHQVGGHLVPVPGLAQDVESAEAAGGTGLLPLVRARAVVHFSRRKIAASRPIPPTIVTSNGASRGGPISRL